MTSEIPRSAPRLAMCITKVPQEAQEHQTVNAHLTSLDYDPENNIITIHGRRFKITYLNDQKQRIRINNPKDINAKIQQIYKKIFSSEKIGKITKTSIQFDEGKISYSKGAKTRDINLNTNNLIRKNLNDLKEYFKKPENYTLWTSSPKEDEEDESSISLGAPEELSETAQEKPQPKITEEPELHSEQNPDTEDEDTSTTDTTTSTNTENLEIAETIPSPEVDSDKTPATTDKPTDTDTDDQEPAIRFTVKNAE